jgi:hypothetical protein
MSFFAGHYGGRRDFRLVFAFLRMAEVFFARTPVFFRTRSFRTRPPYFPVRLKTLE